MSASELVNYQVQLQQVEAALTTDPANDELLKLKNDLEEVIELTKSLIGDAAKNLPDLRKAEPSKLAQNFEHKFRPGDLCQAPWSEDGQYYDAKIDDLMSDGQCNVIFSSLPNGRHHVLEVCLVALLKPTLAQQQQSQRKKRSADVMNATGKKVDASAQREMLRKKQQKKANRFKELEEAREKDKMKWKQFNVKAAHKHLKGAPVKKQSIFKSPETVDGKVGVGTCGVADKPMTTFVVADKYKRGTLSSAHLPSHLASLKPGTSSFKRL